MEHIEYAIIDPKSAVGQQLLTEYILEVAGRYYRREPTAAEMAEALADRAQDRLTEPDGLLVVAFVGGTVLDSPVLDSPVLDSPVLDSSVFESPAFDGSGQDDSVFDGSVFDGSVHDVSVLDSSVNGPVLGCGGMRLIPGGIGELTRVYVRPSARGAGAGAGLVLELERLAVERGLSALRLDTRSDLIEARKLYARLGFVDIPAFNDDPYAQHWLGKALQTR